MIKLHTGYGMNLARKIAVVLLALSASIACAQTDTLRVATYNLLNFPGSDGPQRVPEFRKILRLMNPDVLAVQEMLSQAGVNSFLNNVLEIIEPGQWSAVPFHDGPDTDNSLFYRTARVEFVSSYHISTSLRDISEYVMRLPAPDTTVILRIYSAHLKAGEEDWQRRLEEATVLRNYLNGLPEGSEFVVVGDFNLYESDEPAYGMLIGGPQNAGRSYDPIDTPGDWHNNAIFAGIHTQATRGGSYGGMDDRFDFLLTSGALFDSTAFQYLEGSYTPFGNDGNHFNMSINDGENAAVPDSIADALYIASDHLPVYLDLLFYSSGQPPTAFIDDISPNPAEEGETVWFSGHGEDTDGTIIGYHWRSSIDGQLSTQASFSTSELSHGVHTIYFKVQDDSGAWSEEVSQTLEIESASVTPNDRMTAKKYAIHQNFPNPFNNRTVIRYDIAMPGQVQLQIFDLLGRRIATLTEGFQQAGAHAVRFDATGLASGTYFYSLSTTQTTQVRRMVLAR